MIGGGNPEWYFGMDPHVDNQEYYCWKDGSGEDWMENLKQE